MEVRLRPIEASDTEQCGRIIYEAFAGIANQHNFTPDFPDTDITTQFAHAFIDSHSHYGVAAEIDGTFVGSNFLAEQDPIRSVGPITVDPTCQSRGIGRRLMEDVIERGRDAVGIRLVQDAFNRASLSLYAALGFDIKEPLALMAGSISGDAVPGYEVRPLEERDVAECSELCQRVHGFDRTNEVKEIPPFVAPFVAVRDGRIAAYATAVDFWPLNHGVAESDEAMHALLQGASAATGNPISFLLPMRETDLFRWCLARGLRVQKPMTLMAMGEYHEPRGTWFPSVGY